MSDGMLRGVDYEDPIVKFRGERILYTLKKVSGREMQLDPSFLVDTFYIHYLPLPLMSTKSDVPEDKGVMYSLLNSIVSSDLVIKNREYSIANSAVSVALTVSYMQHLIEELEKIKRTSQSQEERDAAEQILNGLMKKRFVRARKRTESQR